MNTVDPYRRTDKLDSSLLEVIVSRLEARGRHQNFTRILNEYIDAMHIDDAIKVLDLGCGTGVVARSIAHRSGFAGKITGIDLSQYLTRVAEHLAIKEGVAEYVEFRAGDTRNLDFPDGYFDAVIAHTLFSHIDDPWAAIMEAARVVKPGGAVAIFDGDYASTAFGHKEVAKSQSYDEAIVKAIVTNPRVMRQMPKLLQAAGLKIVATYAHVIADIGKADFWQPAIIMFRHLLPKVGTMSEEEANTLVDSLLHASEENVFFGATSFYSYIAMRR
jgi:ubiquinone/menaquinone biosynthesis C-methylase UbiE